MSEAQRQPLEPELIIPAQHPASPPPTFEQGLERYHRRALWLFLATIVTTFLAGMLTNLRTDKSFGYAAACGVAYSATIMTILVAHEAGHYLQAKRYGIPATPPFFIPMPIPPIGTMGAVIVQGAGYADRRIMFDIAVTGPLAGLAVAIPAIAWAAQYATSLQASPSGTVLDEPLMVLNQPLLVEWLVNAVNVSTNAPGLKFEGVPGAVFFAGWFGVLITGVNLVPLGQLDGGHILYSLIGKRQHDVARFLFIGAVAYFLASFFTGAEFGWGLMLILVALMGIRHPPTRDDRVPLGTVRYVIGWFTLALLLVCFVAAPVSEYPKPKPPPKAGQM